MTIFVPMFCVCEKDGIGLVIQVRVSVTSSRKGFEEKVRLSTVYRSKYI